MPSLPLLELDIGREKFVAAKCTSTDLANATSKCTRDRWPVGSVDRRLMARRACGPVSLFIPARDFVMGI